MKRCVQITCSSLVWRPNICSLLFRPSPMCSALVQCIGVSDNEEMAEDECLLVLSWWPGLPFIVPLEEGVPLRAVSHHAVTVHHGSPVTGACGAVEESTVLFRALFSLRAATYMSWGWKAVFS